MKLPKTYNPKEYEDQIYKLWEEKQAFLPNNESGKDYFSMVIPPPNANGDLHMGHGLTITIEDIAIRYNRMIGKNTLFVPGADHAGFETQTVYEKLLNKQGESRFDYTREELYKQIWDFVEQNKCSYQSQLRRLGASLSWSDFTYTLDKKVVKTAYRTFQKMWEEGLIYRGERLVNYCTFHGTSFADIEVEYQTKKGSIWSLRYPLTDNSGEIIVATTRPETMLGDTAVAINPKDTRYKNLVGKTVKLPLTNREIPIIADEYVDVNFGTGAVKITPAHDPNDYDMSQRHNLPMISVIDHNGLINHNAPKQFIGLSVSEARDAVIKALDEQGLVVEVKDHENNVGHCYKCGTVIEPLLKEQWFVDMGSLTKPAIRAIKSGEVEFYPKNRATQLVNYLENLRDWNISRQIAWGIPIPAFQNVDKPDDWLFDERVDQQIIEVNGQKYHRDPDVFDTWFSSSSWPYATLDYPNGDKFKQYYPLSLMETGFDILYPWVSRMLMMGLYVTGQVPFKKVYLHGLIQDEHGAKMSKSKGNVINPMDKITEYGSDAFRMGIIADEAPASSRPYDESKLVGGRNFCNKLWNIARYTEGILGNDLDLNASPEPQTIADEWILGKLNDAIESISQNISHYRFAEAREQVYHLVWDDLADWYIEASKQAQNASVLNYSLATVLKLTHPFAPFVTETIWQNLDGEGLLISTSWPKTVSFKTKKAGQFAQIQAIISEIRHIKSNLNLQGGILAYSSNNLLDENGQLVGQLAKLSEVVATEQKEGIAITSAEGNCYYVISPELAKQLKDSLLDNQARLKNQIENLEARLNNKSYIQKAPEKLVNETRQELAKVRTEFAKVTDQLTQI